MEPTNYFHSFFVSVGSCSFLADFFENACKQYILSIIPQKYFLFSFFCQAITFFEFSNILI